MTKEEILNEERRVAKVFADRHPEFPRCPAMARSIEKWLKAHNAPFNILNLEAAWGDLTKPTTSEDFAASVAHWGLPEENL